METQGTSLPFGVFDVRRRSQAVYDDLLDLLTESADAQRVLAFRLSDEKQARLDDLLEKNREGTLTDEDSAELDAYERFEHVVRLLKARVLQRLPS
jgi:hypothetical protein